MTLVPDGAGECRLLFVYGTLRRGFRLHPHLMRLGARFWRDAKVAGELFDLGCYPGARPTVKAGRWLRGELYRLGTPERDLRVLDQVEGFLPSAPQRSEFVRAVAEAILTDGSRVRAWIYWLGSSVRSGVRIGSGDFADVDARRASM